MGTQQQQCTLEVWLFMSSMSRSILRLVSNSTTQVILKETRGNSLERWEKHRYKIGPIRRQFSLILEVVDEDAAPAVMALDNLHLVDCFDGNKCHSLFHSRECTLTFCRTFRISRKSKIFEHIAGSMTTFRKTNTFCRAFSEFSGYVTLLF